MDLIKTSKKLKKLVTKSIKNKETLKLGDEMFGLTPELVNEISSKINDTDEFKIHKVLQFVLEKDDLTEFQKGFIISTLLKTFAMMANIQQMMKSDKGIITPPPKKIITPN